MEAQTMKVPQDHKRVTVPVDQGIDKIKDFIQQQTGVEMTYVQIFNHLIHFYMTHAAEPRTKWAPIFTINDTRTNRPNKGK
jgi:hypothetical protein